MADLPANPLRRQPSHEERDGECLTQAGLAEEVGGEGGVDRADTHLIEDFHGQAHAG